MLGWGSQGVISVRKAAEFIRLKEIKIWLCGGMALVPVWHSVEEKWTSSKAFQKSLHQESKLAEGCRLFLKPREWQGRATGSWVGRSFLQADAVVRDYLTQER